MNTKSYNPFKMWGSLAGALVGLLGVLFIEPFAVVVAIATGALGLCKGEFCSSSGVSWMYILAIIIGSLIGWGIHSLVRKFRS